MGCRFGFDQSRCTRPPKLVVGRGTPRPCRPAALLQVIALLPVGSDISQGSQVCLRIAVLHELLHTDRREDFHDCGASLLSRKFVGGCVTHPPKENPMTIDATAPIAIPCRRRVRNSPWRIDGTCVVLSPSIRGCAARFLNVGASHWGVSHSARKSEASILHFAHRGAPMFAHAIMTTFELLARLPTRKAAAAYR